MVPALDNFEMETGETGVEREETLLSFKLF